MDDVRIKWLAAGLRSLASSDPDTFGERASELRESADLLDELSKLRALLIEAEGMLCDPLGGPAANECAERIRSSLRGEQP